MKLLNSASGYVFTRNPIIVMSDDNEHQQQGISSYSVMYAGKRVFEGRFSLPFKIDISEISDIYASYLPDIATGGSKILRIIEGSEELRKRTISFEYLDDHDNPSPPVSAIAIPGGVSRQNFRTLAQKGTDPFKSRFLNRKGNFFLTTRTNSWRVVIPETELYPLFFVVDNLISSGIEVRALNGDVIWSSDAINAGIYALDIEALRRYAFEECDSLLSIFDIYTQGAFSCRIIIQRRDSVKERYRLKFRNSLGVFEIIEVVGTLLWSPEFGNEDNGHDFDRWDSQSQAFSAARSRIDRRQSITIEGIIKKRSELSFFMDMLASEDVFLLDVAPHSFKVIPTIEEFKYKHISTAPEPFALKLAVSDRERCILDELASDTDGKKPRVFSSQFNDKFN